MPILPPHNFQFDPVYITLRWDCVPGADEYEILYKPDNPLGEWDIAYNGDNATCCPFDKPPGVYKFKGKTQKDGDWGDYCAEETVVVSPT